jgi:mRNA interferase MazF
VTVVSHPVQGTIVRVDLSEGFRPPEMTKHRPAVILSPEIPGRPLMCTLVPLSTTPPKPVLAHHMELAFNPPLPEPYDNPTAGLKGDIVLTVAFHRLRLLFDRYSSGQRVYDVRLTLCAICTSSPVAPAIKSSQGWAP